MTSLLSENQTIQQPVQKEIDKANQAAEELIELEHKEEAKKERTRAKRKKKATLAAKKISEQKGNVKNSNTIHHENASSSKIIQSPTLLLSEKLSLFALKLCENFFKVAEHPRIARWETTDVEQIRLFEDRNHQGKMVLRYRNLDEEQIRKQRARHYLPGTERLLKDPSYREIYAFPTDRGFGVVAQFSYQNQLDNGILYFGVDKINRVFHKYFEDVDFKNSHQDFFHDAALTSLPEPNEADEDWISESKFSLDITQEGVLQYKYSDHEIYIQPLRRHLLDQELAKIQ
jgi:hypothetical protein